MATAVTVGVILNTTVLIVLLIDFLVRRFPSFMPNHIFGPRRSEDPLMASLH